MAAITPVLKMKVVGLRLAGQGGPEVVTLEERVSNVTATSNLHGMPPGGSAKLAKMELVIDKSTGQAAFKINREYRVEFTLLQSDGTDIP